MAPCSRWAARCRSDREAVAVEDVVAQRQGHTFAGHEVPADDERLRQPFGLGLRGVVQRDAPLRAVAQEPLERRLVLGRGDDQDVANARQHERGQRVIDHRLVVDRHELLRHRQRHGIEARAGAAGEDDALHDLRHRQAQAFAVVLAARDRLAPGPVREVPGHGLIQAFLERVAGREAELAGELRRVDGVALVVTGPILHEHLQVVIPRRPGRLQARVLRRRRGQFERVAERLHHVEVGALGVAADVVFLARHARRRARAGWHRSGRSRAASRAGSGRRRRSAAACRRARS